MVPIFINHLSKLWVKMKRFIKLGLAICLQEAYSFHVAYADCPQNRVVSVPCSLKKVSRRMGNPFEGLTPAISAKKNQSHHQQHSLNFPPCSELLCLSACRYSRRVKLLAHSRDLSILIRICMGGEFS